MRKGTNVDGGNKKKEICIVQTIFVPSSKRPALQHKKQQSCHWLSSCHLSPWTKAHETVRSSLSVDVLLGSWISCSHVFLISKHLCWIRIESIPSFIFLRILHDVCWVAVRRHSRVVSCQYFRYVLSSNVNCIFLINPIQACRPISQKPHPTWEHKNMQRHIPARTLLWREEFWSRM